MAAGWKELRSGQVSAWSIIHPLVNLLLHVESDLCLISMEKMRPVVGLDEEMCGLWWTPMERGPEQVFENVSVTVCL